GDAGVHRFVDHADGFFGPGKLADVMASEPEGGNARAGAAKGPGRNLVRMGLGRRPRGAGGGRAGAWPRWGGGGRRGLARFDLPGSLSARGPSRRYADFYRPRGLGRRLLR